MELEYADVGKYCQYSVSIVRVDRSGGGRNIVVVTIDDNIEMSHFSLLGFGDLLTTL